MIAKKHFLTHAIDTLDLKNKRVLLRADLNVPLDNQKIISDYKLKAILPTINMLLDKGAKVILVTHLGRPKNHDSNLSTQLLAPFFKQRKYKIKFEPDLNKAIKESLESKFDILLLENIRFFKGERDRSIDFAKKLATLSDYFVNDAFGVSHRDEASTTLVPKLLGIKKSFLGPLIQHELVALEMLMRHPKHPFTVMLGGGKVSTKLPMLEKLLSKNKIDTLLLCPAIVFTFLKYMGKKTGNSLVDNTLLPIIPKILKIAKKQETKILYPIDYLVAKDNFDGPISYIDQNEVPDNFVGISIGPKTIKLFAQEINQSKTVFSNGTFGNIKKEKTLEGLKTLFKAMAKSNIYTVIAGGDSVAAAYMFKTANKIDYLSTGGGASLAYISGEKLPSLSLFNKN